MKTLTIDPQAKKAPTRDLDPTKSVPGDLPPPKAVKAHPSATGNENASLYFIGTATTILYAFLRI